jgi:hypothetical protein
MLALGSILVLVAVGVSVSVIAGDTGGPAVVLDLGGLGVISLSALAVFLLGASCVLVVGAAYELLRAGARRERQRRQDAKELSRLTAAQAQETSALDDAEMQPHSPETPVYDIVADTHVDATTETRGSGAATGEQTAVDPGPARRRPE